MNTHADSEAIAMLQEVVEHDPERVYQAPAHQENGDACYYVHTNVSGGLVGPGCLFGHVAYRLGVPLEELAMHEGNAAQQVFSKLFPSLSSPTLRTFDCIQEYQDSGYSWEGAYEAAMGKRV
ncbi:hypothetical protein [Streptomyces sp. NPDC051561]|uniref:hypothetical protein n=1 Tax=Streptomyces sp. NPDC051561 TaxID=3365658 RepID=UPI00379C74FF